VGPGRGTAAPGHQPLDTVHGVTMEEQDPQRRAAQYRLDRLILGDTPSGPEDPAHDQQPPATTEAPAAPDRPRPATMAARGAFADELVRQAMARGEFDDLPLTGKPIPGLTGRHDPDWWLKAFIEREQITGVLPEALQLRKDDGELDDRLDREHLEEPVRRIVEEFNARIVAARRQLLGGPPVVTPTRDVEVEVTRWRDRRRARASAARAADDADAAARLTARDRRGRWWRRGATPDRGAPPR
jgi:hypothetical protein